MAFSPFQPFDDIRVGFMCVPGYHLVRVSLRGG
jgi:hypothetical protein